jgi:hypothetical protein
LNKKTGRPEFVLDEDEFKKLMRLHATLSETAGWFDVSEDTIEAACKRQFNLSFSECFKKWSAGGKISLRRAQWIAATEKHNTALLIWLGKQYLGQKDMIEHSGNPDKAPIQLAYAQPVPQKKLESAIEAKINEVIEVEAKSLDEPKID